MKAGLGVACCVLLVVSCGKTPTRTPAAARAQDVRAATAIAGAPNIDVLASFNVTEVDPGEVHAEGTWTTPDGKPSTLLPSRLNAVQISCRREIGVCVESIAQVIASDPSHLRLDQIEYSIIGWRNRPTPHEITALLPQPCVTSTLTINLATREVLRITSKGGLSPDTCNTDPEFKQLFSKPLIETLTDWQPLNR
jgi:hypothetical protein